MCFKAFGMGRKLKFCGVVSWFFGLSGQSVIGDYLRVFLASAIINLIKH